MHLEWEIKAQKIKDIPRYYQKACDEFLNFSCFLARYLEAGLMDESPDRCKYSGIDVREALDHDLPQGPLRDCQLMVAAQHILLAGRVLAEECFYQSIKGFGPDKWRRWAAKLEEISRREREKNESLASAAKDAHEYMLSLPYEPPTSTWNIPSVNFNKHSSRIWTFAWLAHWPGSKCFGISKDIISSICGSETLFEG